MQVEVATEIWRDTMNRSKGSRYRTMGCVALLALFAAFVSGCGDDDPAASDTSATTEDDSEATAPSEPIGLKVGVVPATSALTPYVAEQAGIFDEVGLDVELVVGAGGPQLVAALLGGSVDVALGTPGTAIAPMQQGSDLVAIPPFSQLDFELIVPTDSSIESASDLKGKTVGVTALGGAFHLWAETMLADAGLDPTRDVTFIATPTLPATIAAVQQGSVDATVMLGAMTPAVKSLGLDARPVLTSLEDPREGINEWGLATFWVAGADFLDSEPGARYCTAMERTLEWMGDPDNAEEGSRIIAELIGSDDEEAAANTWEIAAELWKDSVSDEHWQDNVEWSIGADQSVPTDEFVMLCN